MIQFSTVHYTVLCAGAAGRGAPDLRPHHHGPDVRLAGDWAGQVSTVQYSTVQYSTVQYSTVQYSTVQPVCRLYRWAQATVRNTELSEGALAGLGQAMAHLQHRDVLFQVTIDRYFYSSL